MNKARLSFTSLEGNTQYAEPAWRAFTEDGDCIAVDTSKRAVQKKLAWINRQVKSGTYSKRPLYTGY